MTGAFIAPRRACPACSYVDATTVCRFCGISTIPPERGPTEQELDDHYNSRTHIDSPRGDGDA